MKQVRIFSQDSAGNLEKEINEFLKNNSSELVDIKFTTDITPKSEARGLAQAEWYTALVIYNV